MLKLCIHNSFRDLLQIEMQNASVVLCIVIMKEQKPLLLSI